MDFIDKQRRAQLLNGFQTIYHHRPQRIIRSSGRMELIGNHTDHQGGKVLVAAINLFVYAAISPREDSLIHVFSQGFPSFTVDTTQLAMVREEQFTSQALVRGIVQRIIQLGLNVGGLNVYIESDVPPGSGVSSSAAFEMLIVEVFNQAFNQGKINPILRAQIGQYAENHYFGKPSGLLDQMGVSLGGINYIDFSNPEMTLYQTLEFPFPSMQFLLVDTGGDHANLTSHYQAIREEMESVAKALGGLRLSEVEESTFRDQYATLPFSQRALNRAMHYYEENQRVELTKQSLLASDATQFIALLNQSGISSETLLENITFPSDRDQRLYKVLRSLREAHLPIALRVHGGGFAGTILIGYDRPDELKVQSKLKQLVSAEQIINVHPVAQPIISEEIYGTT